MSRSIVVVDGRTYRKARRQVRELEDAGDYRWAHAGAIAITLWLRNRVRYGWKRRRLARAVALEQWELRRDQLHDQVLASYGLAPRASGPSIGG